VKVCVNKKILSSRGGCKKAKGGGKRTGQGREKNARLQKILETMAGSKGGGTGKRFRVFTRETRHTNRTNKNMKSKKKSKKKSRSGGFWGGVKKKRQALVRSYSWAC